MKQSTNKDGGSSTHRLALSARVVMAALKCRPPKNRRDNTFLVGLENPHRVGKSALIAKGAMGAAPRPFLEEL